MAHNECLNIVRHCASDNLLCLLAHLPNVVVVVLVEEVLEIVIVEFGVVVVVVSQLLQVLAH